MPTNSTPTIDHTSKKMLPIFKRKLEKTYAQIQNALSSDPARLITLYLEQNELPALRELLTHYESNKQSQLNELKKNQANNYEPENKNLIFCASTPEAIELLSEFGFSMKPTQPAKGGLSRVEQALQEGQHTMFKACVAASLKEPYSRLSGSIYENIIQQVFANPQEVKDYLEDIEFVLNQGVKFTSGQQEPYFYLCRFAQNKNNKEKETVFILYQFLLDKRLEDINQGYSTKASKNNPHSGRETPFVLACQWEHREMVDFLLNYYQNSQAQLLKFQTQIQKIGVKLEYQARVEKYLLAYQIPSSTQPKSTSAFKL